MPQVKPEIETFAKIKVVGVGGGGGSAVMRMVDTGIKGVEFIALNTDVQALHHNPAQKKVHIGKTVTRGLGAGMDPDMGKRSAEEAQNEIREVLKDADMVFITAGMGGGTGTGAAPVVAEIAKDLGALTVAIVTKPFSFEGPQRKKLAEGGLQELSRHVDTIVTIPNDRVMQLIDKRTPLNESFQIIDDVLRQGVQGISELITVAGIVNVDFADVKAIMANAGPALMGIGMGSGDNAAIDAAKAAVSSPLLELSIDGAKNILFTITGGMDLAMQDVSDAAELIREAADEDVKMIFGANVDESLGDGVRITVVATGFEAPEKESKLQTREIDNANDLDRTRSFFTKSTFRKKELDEEEEPTIMPRTERTFEKKSVHTMPPVKQPPMVESQPMDSHEDDDDEDDLEIPAFIRKKMGV